MPNAECRVPNEDALEAPSASPHSALRTPHFPIAYIAGQFPLRSETFVWREVRELRRRGWTVHTFGLHAPDGEVPDSLRDLRATTIDVYADRARMPLSATDIANAAAVATLAAKDAMRPGERLSPRGRLALIAQAQAGCRLAWRLRDLGVRHVHAHFAHAPASVAMYSAQAAGVPFSFTGHANDLFQRRQALALKLKRAAFVACISEWHRSLYQSIVPRERDRYPIVRCGVEVEAGASAGAQPRPATARVLSVCRLVEKKGIDLLIRSAANLRDRGRRFQTTIAGDGPMRPALEALVADLNLGTQVTFLGAVDSGQVRELLRQADAFVLPCRVDANGDRDGIPVVLMEAMAAGVPVVSGDLPAIRELITDGQTGRLVNAEQVDELATAIGQVLEGGPAVQQFVIAGRERVANEFSLIENVKRLETLFIQHSLMRT